MDHCLSMHSKNHSIEVLRGITTTVDVTEEEGADSSGTTRSSIRHGSHSEVHAGLGGDATPIQPVVRASPPPQLDLVTSTSLLLLPTTPFRTFHARPTEACRRPAYARRPGYSPATAGGATFDALLPSYDALLPNRGFTQQLSSGNSVRRGHEDRKLEDGSSGAILYWGGRE